MREAVLAGNLEGGNHRATTAIEVNDGMRRSATGDPDVFAYCLSA